MVLPPYGSDGDTGVPARLWFCRLSISLRTGTVDLLRPADPLPQLRLRDAEECAVDSDTDLRDAQRGWQRRGA